ncbi:MAG TPA: hypothetical protein VGO64_06480 [Candidatus Limnocylindrales bacterium]|nr:hypothetical protein [Candidatus Limnocylindrales bacterium]
MSVPLAPLDFMAFRDHRFTASLDGGGWVRSARLQYRTVIHSH